MAGSEPAAGTSPAPVSSSVVKPTRSLSRLDEERAIPGSDATYVAHLARYEFVRPLVRGQRVLEVGSGEGYGAALLAGVARSVRAVDYAPVAVEHAREKYALSNLEFRVANATALPFADGTFDIAIAFEILEHTEDHDRVVSETARVLRRGGKLLVSTPNAKLERAFEKVAGRAHYEYHINTPDVRELRRVLKRHLSEVRIYGQSERRSFAHMALKTLDVLNLRHRLVRSRAGQGALLRKFFPSAGHKKAIPTDEESAAGRQYRFSRLLASRSPMILGVAVKRR